MTTLQQAAELGSGENGLVVVATTRADGTVQSSVVNAGVLSHPVSGEQVLGMVILGRVKLANLRARPAMAATYRRGWSWATVEGRAELIGPDDPSPGVHAEGLRRLLRDIFAAAGGTHQDWEEYDRTMREQRRTAVLVRPTRVYGN